MFWNFSKKCEQSLHIYSYVGIVVLLSSYRSVRGTDRTTFIFIAHIEIVLYIPFPERELYIPFPERDDKQPAYPLKACLNLSARPALFFFAPVFSGFSNVLSNSFNNFFCFELRFFGIFVSTFTK